jgi:hypothetical protein
MRRTILLLLSVIMMNALLIHSLDSPREIYVCEAGDVNFVGTYKESTELVDGAPIYTNSKVCFNMSITTITIITTTTEKYE